MNMHHLRAIIRKEFFHILRDPGTLLLVTVGPVFLMLVFSYTLTSDVKNAPIGVIDQAQNDASADLIAQLDADKVIHITQHLENEAAADDLFLRGKIVAAVVIPAGYGEFEPAQLLGMLSGQTSMPQVRAIIDGTEPVSAETVLEEVYAITDAHSRQVMINAVAGTAFEDAAAEMLQNPVNVTQERLYNPDLRSIVDIYPALAAMMLTLPAIALTMALAREAEAGTLEQLISTPINKRALLVGKMVPYLVFGMIDVYVLLVLGWVLYDVPFEGSLLLYSLLAFLFIVANLGIALLLSVFLRSQQVAMMVAILVFFIPPFFLSGLFFPVTAMPWIIRLELIEIPSTHYVAASRAIQLQGAGLGSLVFPFVVLVILAVELLEIAAFVFRKKVIITFDWRKLLGRESKQEQIHPSNQSMDKAEMGEVAR